MSNELERRLKALEQRVIPSLPHSHGPAILINPIEDKIQAMEDVLNECPLCQKAPAGAGPRMMVIRTITE